jgi:aminoglycoside N3'-acetyltransferase
MLQEITEDKTLVMPSFTFGGSSAEIIKNIEKRPFFDKKKSPTQVGLINELFRRQPGVKRSLHPTLSVCAFGPLAEKLTSSHHLAGSKMGKGTPFGIMDAEKTIILGIGVYYFRNLSHVHTVEDLMGNKFPYPHERKFREIKVALIDGEFKYDYLHKEDSGEAPAFERDLTLLEKVMFREDLKQWKYHGVPLFYARAGKITEALAKSAGEGLTIYNYKAGGHL